MGTIPEVTIKSRAGTLSMPVIGMGTASTIPPTSTGAVKSAIIDAIRVGYRHFDTSPVYMTEQPLGEGIAEALEQKLIKSRDEVFVTTKLWCTCTERSLVLPAIKKSLRNLGLEYVDLYLIHWPVKVNMKLEEFRTPVPPEYVSDIDTKSLWEAMEECQNLGLTKAIGVSNFPIQKLQQILSFSPIPPAVNQVEMNPLWQQKELRDFCNEKGIIVTAYSPLGAMGTRWGDNRVLQNNLLIDIAKSKGKTPAQVSLRWLYEQGVSIVAKSFSIERMKENMDIFDWSLTEEESKKIGRISQQKGVTFGMMMAQTTTFVHDLDSMI